jgi:hypothetical protein
VVVYPSPQIGNPSGKEVVDSVCDIHGFLINSDRVWYYCKLVLQELGYVPERQGAGLGNKFITDMFH